MEREKFDHFTVSCSLCARDIYGVASVMVLSGANVPAIYSMRCPCAADRWFFMNKTFGSEGGDGCLVEIKSPIEHGFCSHFGVSLDGRRRFKVRLA